MNDTIKTYALQEGTPFRNKSISQILQKNTDSIIKKLRKKGVPASRTGIVIGALHTGDMHSTTRFDIVNYAISLLCNEDYSKIPKDELAVYTNPSSIYNYDSKKGGQNIIKHGISFPEAVSYSSAFGRYGVPVKHKEEERQIFFSNLNLKPAINTLQFPLSKNDVYETTLNVTTIREGKLRLISSRPMSRLTSESHHQTVRQAINNYSTEKGDIDRLVERIIESMNE